MSSRDHRRKPKRAVFRKYVCGISAGMVGSRTQTIGCGDLLFVLPTGARNGAGFGAFRGPVFGREGDTPELGAGHGEFEANFGLVAAHGAKKNHVALLLFGSPLVL